MMLEVVLSESNSFFLYSISKGKSGPCTVTAIIDSHKYVFELELSNLVQVKLKQL